MHVTHSIISLMNLELCSLGAAPTTKDLQNILIPFLVNKKVKLMTVTIKLIPSCNHLVYYYLIQNSQAVKKECGPQKGYGEKRCEIQGGSQEMAVMVG